jgi:phosphate transport system substrate-binding protein
MLDITQADLTIRIGESSNLASSTYQIGTDDVKVIANRQNPIDRLTIEQVRGLFTGQIQNWKDIQGADAPVQVWVFASGEDVQQIFEQTSLGGTPVTSAARLATGPDEMAQAIANDINAVGIFTSHWDTGNASILFSGASVPVLASTSSEPQGALPQILACLQK